MSRWIFAFSALPPGTVTVPLNEVNLPSWWAVILAPVHSTFEVPGSITYVTVSAAGVAAGALAVVAGPTVALGALLASSHPESASVRDAAASAKDSVRKGVMGLLGWMNTGSMLSLRAGFQLFPYWARRALFKNLPELVRGIASTIS